MKKTIEKFLFQEIFAGGWFAILVYVCVCVCISSLWFKNNIFFISKFSFIRIVIYGVNKFYVAMGNTVSSFMFLVTGASSAWLMPCLKIYLCGLALHLLNVMNQS